MIPIHNCWHCGKSLLNIEIAEDAKDVPFFHCDKICQSKCKIWNYKPEPFTDENWADEDTNGQIIEVEEPIKRDDYQCPHKYNCKNHKEVCMAKHGYSKF